MKGAVLYGAHDWRIKKFDTPDIDDNEVLINVKACGVCHSEIHQWDVKVKGLKYPRYIGHEVAGEILETGKNVNNFKIGDRVAVWTDGKGYAEQVGVRTEKVFKIADNISFEEAMAEPISCTTNGVNRADVHENDSVVLVGTGFMGLILLQQLKLKRPRFIAAIDVRKEILEIAKKLGADYIINPKKEKPSGVIKELTDGKGADVVFEVGGNETTLNSAAEVCRMEGKFVIFGFHPGPRLIKDLGYWNWMAFDIINAHFRDLNRILEGTREGMEMLNSGKINMKPLITHKFPLEEIENAFTAAKEKPKGFIKSVIAMK